MSEDQFRMFLKTLNEDKKFEQKAAKLRKSFKRNKKLLNEEETQQFLEKKLIPFARKSGFNFNTMDAYTVINEINQDNLQHVAGGKLSPKSIGITALSSLGLLSASLGIKSAMNTSNKPSEQTKDNMVKLGTTVDLNGMLCEIISTSGEDTNVRLLSYKGSERIVKIPEKIQDSKTKTFYKVVAIEQGAFSNTKVESVDLSETSISEIPKKCFENCRFLTHVALPPQVKVIKEACFANCERLDQVQLPHGLEKMGKSCFEGCKNLKQIVIPNTVKKVDNQAFVGCPSLEVVVEKGSKLEKEGSEALKKAASLKVVDDVSSVIKQIALKNKTEETSPQATTLPSKASSHPQHASPDITQPHAALTSELIEIYSKAGLRIASSTDTTKHSVSKTSSINTDDGGTYTYNSANLPTGEEYIGINSESNSYISKFISQTFLEKNDRSVFVFGTNSSGVSSSSGGTAGFVYKYLLRSKPNKVAEGYLTKNAFGINTMEKGVERNLQAISRGIELLENAAKTQTNVKFLVTPLGTGIGLDVGLPPSVLGKTREAKMTYKLMMHLPLYNRLKNLRNVVFCKTIQHMIENQSIDEDYIRSSQGKENENYDHLLWN